MQVDTLSGGGGPEGPQGPSGGHDRGGMRMDAVWRIVVGGLYLLLYAFIIAPLLFTVGVILMIVDVLWQLITGREGIAPMNLWQSAWDVQADNAKWALVGSGEFELTIFGG